MTECVHCCENLLLESVSSWQMVAESCNLISDNLDVFPETDDLDPSLVVIDAQREPWRLINYWQHVASIAERNMSPSELMRYRDEDAKSRHQKRLTRDFFQDFWECFEPESQRLLVEQEIDWHNSPELGGSIYSVPNKLRLVFEYELNAIVFKRIKKSLKEVLSDAQLRKDLRLTSRDANTIGLREMAVLLEKAKPGQYRRLLAIRSFIGKLSLGPDDIKFIYEQLPVFLYRLAEVRRKPEHRIHTNKLADEIRKIRNIALGIGEPSYLKLMCIIKNVAKSKSDYD